MYVKSKNQRVTFKSDERPRMDALPHASRAYMSVTDNDFRKSGKGAMSGHADIMLVEAKKSSKHAEGGGSERTRTNERHMYSLVMLFVTEKYLNQPHVLNVETRDVFTDTMMTIRNHSMSNGCVHGATRNDISQLPARAVDGRSLPHLWRQRGSGDTI